MICDETSVIIALETYGMASAPSRKTPPLQFPMEKHESYVIIPEADADLCVGKQRFLLATESLMLGSPGTR